jgi:glutathione synthase/RimK-type ligase-like ATP-grasp enzyme
VILIVTNRQDITADLVVLRLQQRELPYIRFNTEEFPSDVKLSWRADRISHHGALHFANQSVDLATITSVWYRRPVPPVPEEQIEDSGARRFAASESQSALRNVWSLLDCRWVSRPDRIRLAEQKLHQLRIAAQVGLDIPTSCVTSSPEEAREFCRSQRSVIAKSLGRGHVTDEDGRLSIIYTQLLKPTDFERLESVALAPTLFQEEVPRAFDLRVNVVGRRIFATEIHVHRSGGPVVDWRREDAAHIEYRDHQLPSDVADRVLRLVQTYGLQFGALDFVVTPQQRYVFLEINPNGQWAWIEQETGTAISHTLVDLLSGKDKSL